jgi:hypothetical protein
MESIEITTVDGKSEVLDDHFVYIGVAYHLNDEDRNIVKRKCEEIGITTLNIMTRIPTADRFTRDAYLMYHLINAHDIYGVTTPLVVDETMIEKIFKSYNKPCIRAFGLYWIKYKDWRYQGQENQEEPTEHERNCVRLFYNGRGKDGALEIIAKRFEMDSIIQRENFFKQEDHDTLTEDDYIDEVARRIDSIRDLRKVREEIMDYSDNWQIIHIEQDE